MNTDDNGLPVKGSTVKDWLDFILSEWGRTCKASEYLEEQIKKDNGEFAIQNAHDFAMFLAGINTTEH